MARRRPPAVLALLLTSAVSSLAFVACGSRGGGSGPPPDGGADARPDRDGDGPSRDAAGDADAREASDVRDAGPPDTSPCTTGGDRDLSPSEPYPAALFIQNGGRVYDVRSPPTSTQHAAAGDGVTDDTAAIQDAWDYLKDAYVAAGANNAPTWDAENFWVYFPKGTYLVSDTLIYRGGTLETDPMSYVWNDVVHVRFYGESRATTTIRLKDGSPGFGDATMPKVVLAMQHPDTVFNNLVGENSVRNLTIDVGKNNPGAVGLLFQGANATSMRDVTVRSEDGQGAYGVWFKIGSVQGYYRDLSVFGFDYGIYDTANAEMDPALEHVSLRGQNKAAVGIVGGGLSLREVCSDQTKTKAQGLYQDQQGSQVVILDSSFAGHAHAAALEMTATTEQSLFVRDVTTAGYDSAIVRAGTTAAPSGSVDEWVALPTVTMFDGGTAHTLRLPVEDTPIVGWFDPEKDWADVDTFGAVGDGVTDDTAAVEAAMGSGKPVVVFPKAQYKVTKTIDIPPSVQRVDQMSGEFGSGGNTFSVTKPSSTPLLVEHVSGYARFTLLAARPLVLSEYSGAFLDMQSAPEKVYLENCDNIGADPTFAPANQTTWARSIDTENVSGDDFLVSGGTIWIFDYKTENKPTVSLHAENGASVEAFNGYINTTNAPGTTPMIVNDRSRMSFIGFTNLSGSEWTTSLEEVRAKGTQTVPFSALPPRGYGTNVIVPLYAGDARK